MVVRLAVEGINVSSWVHDLVDIDMSVVARKCVPTDRKCHVGEDVPRGVGNVQDISERVAWRRGERMRALLDVGEVCLEVF